MARGHTGSNGCVVVIIFAVLRSSVTESNIAISGTAEQSTNHDYIRWLASAAVDSCVQTILTSGCCSHTKAGQYKTAWWRVDLGTLTTINAIRIYYRGNEHINHACGQYSSVSQKHIYVCDLKCNVIGMIIDVVLYALITGRLCISVSGNSQRRFAGYQLYVSNTSSTPLDGVLCYKDMSSTEADVQLIVTHQCPYIGRYVTVYNSRNTLTRYDWYDNYAVLELCEVQVWGCSAGTYGNGSCDSVCPSSCFGGNCNASTGACFYCFIGSYGDFCSKSCPLYCKNSKCEKDNGICYECTDGKRRY
ncbi:uncharacterized protein [Argopecten irradians]|uniref:uncharacterized protein n=1 Tax=Argopecten irradians TaxID=31199 RepID=UPI0037199681